MKLLDSRKVISVVALWVALGFGRWSVLAGTLDADIYKQINWAQQSSRDVSDLSLSFAGLGDVKEAYYNGSLLSPLEVWCLGNDYFRDAPVGSNWRRSSNREWIENFFSVWSYWQGHRTVVVTSQQQPKSYQLACDQVAAAVRIESNSPQIQKAIRDFVAASQNKQKKGSPRLSNTLKNQQSQHRGPTQLSTNNQEIANVTYKDPELESVLFNNCNGLKSQQNAGLTVTILQDTHLYDIAKLESLVKKIQEKRPSKKSILWLAGDMLEQGLGSDAAGKHKKDLAYWKEFADFVLNCSADEVWLGMGNHDGSWPATYLDSVADLCGRSEDKVKFVSNVMDTETLPALREDHIHKLTNNGMRYVTIGNVAFIGFSDSFPSWGMGTGAKGLGKALSQGAAVFTPLFIHQMCNNYGGRYSDKSYVGPSILINEYQDSQKQGQQQKTKRPNTVPGKINLKAPLEGYPATQQGKMNLVGLSCLKVFKDAVEEVASHYKTGDIYVVVANHNDARNFLAYLNRASHNIVKDSETFRSRKQEYLLAEPILNRLKIIVAGGHVHGRLEIIEFADDKHELHRAIILEGDERTTRKISNGTKNARDTYWNEGLPIKNIKKNTNGVIEGVMPIFYGRKVTRSSTVSQLEKKSVNVSVIIQNVKGGHDSNPQHHSALVCSFSESDTIVTQE